jgi:hypothetical protein
MAIPGREQLLLACLRGSTEEIGSLRPGNLGGLFFSQCQRINPPEPWLGEQHNGNR